MGEAVAQLETAYGAEFFLRESSVTEAMKSQGIEHRLLA